MQQPELHLASHSNTCHSIQSHNRVFLAAWIAIINVPQLLRICMLELWEFGSNKKNLPVMQILTLRSIGCFCIKMIRSELGFGAIFYKKLHDFLFINFGGKFCNIRLNFSTQKIFTKVGHDISLKGAELHQLYVFERYFPIWDEKLKLIGMVS